MNIRAKKKILTPSKITNFEIKIKQLNVGVTSQPITVYLV